MKFFPETVVNKTHVIELYAEKDKYDSKQVKHEIISGTDAGTLLTAIYEQDVRFVYVSDPEKMESILAEAMKRGYTQSIINLYEPEDVEEFFSSRINNGDTILINAQFDSDNELVAGYEAEDLIDLLLEDLELKNKKLANLDIDTCMLGRVKSYRDELRNKLNNFQKITTYTELCSVSPDGPRRIWIRETEDEEFIFYKENQLDKEKIRIIEHTTTYVTELKKAWAVNPEDIDLSDYIDFSVSNV